jgi:site-specific DNA-cytosine methylase
MSTKDNIEILTLDHYLKLKAEGYEFEGQSYLFWEYIRIMKEVKPKHFFLENVMMGEKWERVISKTLGVNPVEINSALVSAQNRRRLYWTNIGMQPAGLFGDLESIIKMPEDKKLLLKDILQDNPNAKYYVSEKMIAKINRTNNSEKCFNVGDKSLCLAAGYYKQGRDNQYITEQIDEKYYLNDDQIEKVLAKTGVDPNIDEPKILDVYNNVIKQDGKSITLTDPCHNNLRLIEPVREVKQINDSNLKSNGGTQPYQQDRVYDTEGISPALAANKSDLLIKEPIPIDEKYYLSDKMTKNMSIYGNENDSILGHSGSGGQKGLIFNTNAQVGSLCATDYKQPKQIIVAMRGRQNEDGKYEQELEPREDGKTNTLTSVYKDNLVQEEVISGTLRTHNDGKGFRSIKNNKGATIPARAREDGSGQNVVSIGNRIRRLTPIECERLQTVPDNYTASVSDTQRYKMLGNGWTVDVIAHIFKYLIDVK